MAAGVVVLTLVILVFGQTWLIAPLAYGFVARALTGPTLSPLGQLVTRVVTPALPVTSREVPGPPKRFAQAIGATLSVGAAVAPTVGAGVVAGGSAIAAALLAGPDFDVAAITAAASLEAVLGFCLGCKIFALLMKAGVIPESTCEACNDLTLRRPAAVA